MGLFTWERAYFIASKLCSYYCWVDILDYPRYEIVNFAQKMPSLLRLVSSILVVRLETLSSLCSFHVEGKIQSGSRAT
jgi:hypothetical protein